MDEGFDRGGSAEFLQFLAIAKDLQVKSKPSYMWRTTKAISTRNQEPQPVECLGIEFPNDEARRACFLEKVGRATLNLFSTADFLLLDQIQRQRKIPDQLQPRLRWLVEKGIIARFGRGRGVKYILSRRYYKMVGKKGAYTRKKGLDRETNKALLLKYIQENRDNGSRLKELMQVLPALSMPQVQTVLRELKSEGKINSMGRTRATLWYPAPAPDTITPKKTI
jgi:hypothetical protein